MRRFTRLTTMACTLAAAGALLAACDDDAAAAPDSRDEWCALIADVDVRFEAADTSSDGFAAQQDAYREIRDRLEQLDDGIDQVDAEVREDVRATLAFGGNLVNAIIGAADEQDAEVRLGAVFDGATTDALPGGAWILDNCGVDVDG